MATHTIDAISICSGIGGLDLGVRRAMPGVRTILYVEREVSAAAILAARMRDGLLESAPVWSDVATLTGAECSDYVRTATGGRGIGMLYGGIPCQPHSVAGKRRGADDERDLWPVTLRAIEHYRPGLFFLENVPGILGFMSERIVPDLRRVGYVVPRPCLLAAADVGASQRRERVFLLAHRGLQYVHIQQRICWTESSRRCEHVGDTECYRGGTRKHWILKKAAKSQREDFTTRCSRFPPGPGFGLDRVAQKVLDALVEGEPDAGDHFLTELAQWASWQRILEVRPDLAPAVKSEVRRVAHESAGKLDISRADQLRGLGNGVVPECAEEALMVLLGRASHALHRVR